MLRLSVSTSARITGLKGVTEPAGRVRCAAQGQSIISGDERTTQLLATRLAQQLCPGDAYLLTGPVGAGKSVFSRAFIRAAYEDDLLPVPSPTYLLQNIYDELEGPEIHHFDLYRLDNPASLGRLQLDQSFRSAVSLVEWAERLPEQHWPADRLDVHITPLDVAAQSGQPAEDADTYADLRQREIMLVPHGRSMTERCQNLLPLE